MSSSTESIGADSCIESGGLRSIYRDPSKVVIDKAIDHVDDGVRGFIERSPIFVLATTDGTTTDASPRGGTPGFVRVLDEHRIAFGDLVGNNRLDSYSNLLQVPAVGLLFMVPGLLETLRVNGRASLSVDTALREQCAIDGRVPKVAVVIDVDECFIHCGAAFRRGSVWDTTSWPAADDLPSPGAILKEHAQIDGVSGEEIEQGLAEYYDTAIWLSGGAGDE